MSYSYAANNFNKAIHALAKGGLQKRDWLASKYVEHILRLELSDIPDEIKSRFCQLRHDLRFVKSVSDPRPFEASAAAIRAMNKVQVEHIVADIVAMGDAIALCEKSATQRA